MTDPAIIAASYAAERNYSHNPDDVIDPSGAVGAWGTAKEGTTKLVDLSGNTNIADIHGPMPTEGFIQGRRFDGVDDYINCKDIYMDEDFTFSCWVHAIDNGTRHMIFHKEIYAEITASGNIHFKIGTGEELSTSSVNVFGALHQIKITRKSDTGEVKIYINGILKKSSNMQTGNIGNSNDFKLSADIGDHYMKGIINLSIIYNNILSNSTDFNKLARLPFWSVNYTDYPDNVTEYTDNLPYSSSIINSGTFKVDDDKLQCVSAGTMTYSASYEFDGSEFVKVTIGGVEYAGTGTITQGNTTVSVAQGSNKVTIQMGTGDAVEGEIGIQFREEA